MEELIALMWSVGYHPHLCTNCQRLYGHDDSECPAIADPTTVGKRGAFLTDSCSACADPELIARAMEETAFLGPSTDIDPADLDDALEWGRFTEVKEFPS